MPTFEQGWLVAFPTLGFFSSTLSDCLTLELPGTVSELELRLETEAAEFLNLRGLQFLKGAKVVPLDEVDFEVEQSSVGGGSREHDPTALTAMRGCHTAAERHPSWRIRFHQPIAADQLRIFNRADRWGSRSASLAVDVTDAGGRRATLHRGYSVVAVNSVLLALESVVGPLPPIEASQGAPALREWRRAVIALVAAQLRLVPDLLTRIAWRDVIQLVDFWTPRVASDDELMLLAGYLIHQRDQQHANSLRSFSAMLGSRESLDRLAEALATLARVRGATPLILTRHGLSLAGKLVRHVDDVLDHLQDVLSFLESLGARPVIAYGTLLGAVRTGTFIPHDDDVDVLFHAKATSRKGVEDEMAALRQKFLDAGYVRVSPVRFSLNLHVFHPTTKMMVDVFPCWLEEDGRLHLHMESMKVRGIDPDIIHPRGVVSLQGRQLAAPGKAEAFLSERYGPGWRRSDPYFEWPWPLRDKDAPDDGPG